MEFKSTVDYVFKRLFDGKTLFVKYWYMTSNYPAYRLSPLPGRLDGISGGITGGSNICVNKYIDEERKIAASKFIEFIASYEVQKKVLLKTHTYSPRIGLYNDKDVCEEIDCNFFKRIQPVSRPYNKVNDYTNYSTLFRRYAYEFIYGSKTAEEVLSKMNDIDRVYYYTLNTEDSSVGLILFIVHIVIGVIILLSLTFLYINKYKIYFKFFSHDFWYIIIMGIMLQIVTSLLMLGPSNIVKCHLKILTFNLGYSFLLVPTLHKLITNFPEENQKTLWISKHKYIFFSSFIFIDLLLNGLLIITPYNLKTIVDTNRKTFQICKMNSIFGLSMTILMITIKFIYAFAIAFFSFIEWNILETVHDIHFIVVSLYVDGLCAIALIITYYIGNENYMNQSFVYQLIFLTLILSNYIFFYGIKLIIYLLIREDEEINLIQSLIHKFKSTNGNITDNSYNGQCNTTMSEKFHKPNNTNYDNQYSKLIKYHYQTSKSKSFSNYSGRSNLGLSESIIRTEEKGNCRSDNGSIRD